MSLIERLKKTVDRDKITYERSYRLDEWQLAVVVTKENTRYRIALLTDIPAPLVLHWGAAYNSRYEWALPRPSLRPPGTTIFQDSAAQTRFADSDGSGQLVIETGEEDAPQAIQFVLRQDDNGRWIKEKGQNFFIPVSLPSVREDASKDYGTSALAGEIIKNETGSNSWTLMHRMNLCYDLLDRLGNNDLEGLALIYVWLRFSYIRQLDWQRNYNTKPRELGHAMGRLTYKLAGLYVDAPEERGLIRLIMTTLGPGKDAQRVRDEILNIMHRHHIKEMAGHFMEEWHQKLHNNATPDDIVICEAYLEFLRSGGDTALFYKTLEENGVPRKRLENYERPIKSDPGFIPHLKDALIHDFEHFLEILKEVHSGTDLKTSINTARYLFDAGMHGLMDYILEHRNDRDTTSSSLLDKITEARRIVAGRLGEHQSRVRDLLFLDLALEDLFRAAIEKNLEQAMDVNRLAEFIVLSLDNVRLSDPDEEFENCLMYWKRLGETPLTEKSDGKLWSLQAKAVADRLQIDLGSLIDRYYELIQARAELLGNAFHAAPWSINLFTEEVVRGRAAFVLSLLLRKLDPMIRKNADLGNWHVISPARESNGVVEVVPDLKSVQGRIFSQPAVLVAGDVRGDEEIPAGVVAIITPASIDVLSHLAVRARNAHILFVVSYDPGMPGKLKSLGGRQVKVLVNEIGDLSFEESTETMRPRKVNSVLASRVAASGRLAPFSAYAVPIKDSDEKTSGGKSNNLRRMLGKLPGWIHLPDSVVLPFGVFEKVLNDPVNREVYKRHNELVNRINTKTEGPFSGLLEEMKETILALSAPDEMAASIQAVMESAGLGRPGRWDDAWTRIKRVWGSKWTERAFLSRRANGISHENLVMAVLVQRVVEADYSFVIHTANPFTNNKDELYAEVVLGLGEALVANYPGSALGVIYEKGEKRLRLLSLPGKSVGLYLPAADAGGLIFRSDSNGEDIAGYAGAGLYDSFVLPEPVKVTLDYLEEALIWDDSFRKVFLSKIAEIGTLVESALGPPQDIEGAYSNGQYFVVQSRPQAGLENE